MENTLLFTFPSSEMFHGRTEIDLSTFGETELKEASSFVFVFPSEYSYRYVHGSFFVKKAISAYVNIDESESTSKIAVFLHVKMKEAMKFDDFHKRNIREFADLMSFPENDQVTNALYGSLFEADEDMVRLVISNFEKAKSFFITFGLEDVPGHRVLTMNKPPIAQADKYTTQKTDDFLNFVFSLPKNLTEE